MWVTGRWGRKFVGVGGEEDGEVVPEKVDERRRRKGAGRRYRGKGDVGAMMD